MSDNLDQMNSFGIQNTMETGAGNTQLLNDLMAPETASSNPDDVEPIINEAEPASAPAKPEVKAGKDIIPPESVDGKTDAEKQTGESLISDFLSDADDDEEDDEPSATPKAKKVEEPKATIDEEDGEDGEEEENGSQFGALANDLFNLGVFNKEEGEEVTINTPEEFLERFNSEKKKGASEIVQNFIGQFGEDYQNAFEAIFVKGANPKEYFDAYNNVVSFSEMDLTQEKNQISVMKQALSDQGFEAEDIDTEIERLQNYGDLDSVSVKHHKVLVKKEAKKLEQMEVQAEQELQQKTAIKNQYISNVQGILSDKVREKEFDGIPINPKIATELQDYLLVDKWKTSSGESLTDFDRAILDLKRPENHEQKVKVGLLMKLLEKDPTLSTIQRTGVTKKSNQLFNEVARQVTKSSSSGTTTSKKKPKSWFL